MYAVIFISQLKAVDKYKEAADIMLELAQKQEGYIAIDSVRDPFGNGITVSYWKDLESIRKWKEVPEHQEAQRQGKKKWYESYRIIITKVEREYSNLSSAGLMKHPDDIY